MVQMVLMSISGGSVYAQHAQRLSNAMFARRMLGLAVVSSGYAVIVAHGLAHIFGG